MAPRGRGGGRSSGDEYIPEGTREGGGERVGDSTALPSRFDDCIIDRVVIKARGPALS